ncbi:hypothetical protein ATANTOWER_001174 [Ataeniobius toweri]|uniref:Uncharacterized protein n=1 Tax=Ataeniobius toweri TaxID=208326 RepID=A0ABU7AMQ8_9TELE|nr:hypothetical protein [Ataeniobius toweri]
MLMEKIGKEMEIKDVMERELDEEPKTVFWSCLRSSGSWMKCVASGGSVLVNTTLSQSEACWLASVRILSQKPHLLQMATAPSGQPSE